MPSVSNLKIGLQAGTDNTYYARWDFNESVKKTKGGPSTSTVKTGNWVTIKSGAKYYNGVSIPSWVMSDTWKVIQVTNGDRAVLGTNKSGTHDIQSAISTKYLTTGSSSSSSKSITSATKDATTNYLDHYTVKWAYVTADGITFPNNESDTKEKIVTYNAPSNAVRINVSVKPVSKTYSVNGKETSYWTGTWAGTSYYLKNYTMEVPPKPEVDTSKIQKGIITLKNSSITNSQVDAVEYELCNGASPQRSNKRTANVHNSQVSLEWRVSPGHSYRFRCRYVHKVSSLLKRYSNWSEMTDIIETVPLAPSEIKEIKALSETSVQVSWDFTNLTVVVPTTMKYEIQYTTEKKYFDTSDKVTTKTIENGTTAIITDMASGEEYFFRLRAVNSIGNSTWTAIKSIIIGKKPTAPTTWSSTTTAITGNPVTLYWVHNAEDGSTQTYATLEMYINNSETPITYTFNNASTIDNDVLSYVPLTEEDRKNGKTDSCILKTGGYDEGASIKWRIKTAGITKEFGEWSIQREITINASPTLELSITDIDGNSIDTLLSFPFYISATAGPKTQMPIGYHVTITSDSQYETVDNMGNQKFVNIGDAVYSKYFDISDPLTLEITPNVISLENNISYTVTCIVSMNSGLTAEESLPFNVYWTVLSYEPDVEIGIDTDTYTAYISPYCFDSEGNNITDVSLSVYRREFDGSFTEIATSVETDANAYIIDPHPSLDYARYRVVATSKTTGSISYYDPPGQPVGGKEVVIQWDEEWSNFDTDEEGEMEEQPWSGSMLKLPYNIDVSESNSLDVSLIEYIGRKHPVTYYGTQIGTGATWNLQVPKDDKETLYALRRLSRWMGDVYVREPSGSGYWANIAVSFSQKHCELTIPVSLTISQVEGGL